MKCKKCKEEKHHSKFSLHLSQQQKGKIVCDDCKRFNVRKIIRDKKKRK